MGNIDMDKRRAERLAKRAAEREGNDEAPTITFQGETFVLPVEMPFSVIGHVARAQLGHLGSITATFSELLGDEYPRLLEQKPTVDDMNDLVGDIMVEYGFVEGESSASES